MLDSRTDSDMSHVICLGVHYNECQIILSTLNKVVKR